MINRVKKAEAKLSEAQSKVRKLEASLLTEKMIRAIEKSKITEFRTKHTQKRQWPWQVQSFEKGKSWEIFSEFDDEDAADEYVREGTSALRIYKRRKREG